MRKIKITAQFSETKTNAVKQYLKEGETIEQLLEQELDVLFDKKVPKDVRTFVESMIAEKKPAPKAPKKDEEIKPNVPIANPDNNHSSIGTKEQLINKSNSL